MSCPHCGGDVVLLGILGDLAHFRCRCCGGDCHEPVGEYACRELFDGDASDDIPALVLA